MKALGFLFFTGCGFICLVTGFFWWLRFLWGWVVGFFNRNGGM